jgi:hypothetical protein
VTAAKRYFSSESVSFWILADTSSMMYLMFAVFCGIGAALISSLAVEVPVGSGSSWGYCSARSV